VKLLDNGSEVSLQRNETDNALQALSQSNSGIGVPYLRKVSR